MALESVNESTVNQIVVFNPSVQSSHKRRKTDDKINGDGSSSIKVKESRESD